MGSLDFLGWPLPGPFGARQCVVGMIGSIWRGVELVQRVDDEAAVAQDLDPLAVAGVELDPSPRSCQAVCLALRVGQFLAGGGGGAQGDQDGGGVEHQFPASSQQSGEVSGTQRAGSHPQAGAAFGDGQVETARRQRDISSVGLDEREGDAEPVLAAAGGLLAGRGSRRPGRPAPRRASQARSVRRSAAELDDVQAADVAEHAELLAWGTLKMPQVMSSAAHTR